MEEKHNEQAILVVSSCVTRKAYWGFYWRWMWRCRKGYFVLLAFLLPFTVVGDLVFFSDSHFFWYTPMFLVLYATTPWRLYNQQCNLYIAETTYAFYEIHVVLRRTVMGMTQYVDIPYTNGEAAETRLAFGIYPPAKKYRDAWAGRDSAYGYGPDSYGVCVILDKQYLAPEQTEALRALFVRKFGEKFKGIK